MTNKKINKLYDFALDNGAIGGKLIGAGGGGFFMFSCTDPENLRKKFEKENLINLNFDFDFQGIKII